MVNGLTSLYLTLPVNSSSIQSVCRTLIIGDREFALSRQKRQGGHDNPNWSTKTPIYTISYLTTQISHTSDRNHLATPCNVLLPEQQLSKYYLRVAACQILYGCELLDSL